MPRRLSTQRQTLRTKHDDGVARHERISPGCFGYSFSIRDI
ncbi:hypothetical protein [Paenarthrobacter sp. CM16]|nr:hypothetical protein [Paenarthrobacter sp. CM16]